MNWIKHCLCENNFPWFSIPNIIFKKCGGLHFLLACGFKCNKLPVKLSNYYKQALDAWKLIYKHNFSPHSCVIWNNQYILFKNKTIFWSDWFNKGLIFVTDLLNQSGDLYNHTELINNSGLHVSSSRKIINCISPKLLHLINIEKMHTSVTGSLPDLAVGGLSIKDKKCNNFYIRNILTRENSIPPKCNGCMPVRAVCKPHSPDLKRGALATDASGCSLWRSLLERPPPAPESRVRDPLGELVRTRVGGVT